MTFSPAARAELDKLRHLGKLGLASIVLFACGHADAWRSGRLPGRKFSEFGD